MLDSFAHSVLGLHGWLAALVVFAVPALECSAFVGIVFPGEIAVLLGGVLASQHKIGLPVAMAAAIAGAIIGDTVGYEIGRRHGRRILNGTVGRIVKAEHLDRAERYLAARGGRAVFLGRFTAALRVLIPGLAGMSGLRYRTFLAYNAAGGVLWAGAAVLAGYAAGDSWHEVERIAGRASLVLLLLVLVVGAVLAAGRWASQNPERVRQVLDRRPFPFLARRLQPRQTRGLSLTVGLVVLAGLGWALGVLTQDVAGHDDWVHFDGPVLRWFVRHREPWLTGVFKVVTNLGNDRLLLAISLAVAVFVWRRRRTFRPVVFALTTFAGAETLYRLIKDLTDHARPATAFALGHFRGSAFPSGHTTMAVAMWGAIALMLSPAVRMWSNRVALWTAAVVIAAVVGVTRLYLGAHWLTDVLAGWTLGAAWLTAVILAVRPNARPKFGNMPLSHGTEATTGLQH